MSKGSKSQQSEEASFLSEYDPSIYPRPSVAVDITLLAVRDGGLVTWLVKRREPPQRSRWSLPGGFVHMHESLHTAAARVLEEKSGVQGVFLEQLFTFGAVSRDPRTRVLSVAYYALIDVHRLAPLVEARDGVLIGEVVVPWAEETGGPAEVRRADGRALRLAFDHAEQVGMAVARLRGKLAYTPIGFQLLAECFTLRELHAVHEAVLGRPLNKDSFRRRMLSSKELEATGDQQCGVEHRPAALYRFRRRSAT